MLPDTAAQADFCFVHLTDTHIMAGGTFARLQIDTACTLRQVVTILQRLDPPPAFAVLGGDLVSPDLLDRQRQLTSADYEPSYHLLQEILRPLPYPTYMVLGNHDNRLAFQRVIGPAAAAPDTTHHYSFDYQGHHFVILDSHVPGESGGRLDAAQLDWLRADLEGHRQQPTLLFVHHHPWPVGIDFIDGMPLYNGAELVSMLRQYPDVHTMICGHVHTDYMTQQHGLTMLTTPSTCFQFSKLHPKQSKFLSGPPSFRLVWVKGLDVSTQVIHLHQEEMATL